MALSDVKSEIDHVLENFWFAMDLEKMVAMKYIYLCFNQEKSKLVPISSVFLFFLTFFQLFNDFFIHKL